MPNWPIDENVTLAVSFDDTSIVPIPINTITGNGTTLTVTCSIYHRLISGQSVVISGSSYSAYNAIWNNVTLVSNEPNVFTLASTLTTSATGGQINTESYALDDSQYGTSIALNWTGNSGNGIDPLSTSTGFLDNGRAWIDNTGTGYYCYYQSTAMPNFSLQNPWTMDVLVLVSALPANELFVLDVSSSGHSTSPQQSAGLSINSNGTAAFYTETTDNSSFFFNAITSGTLFPSANWYHLRGTWENGTGTMKFYAGVAGTLPVLIGTTTVTTWFNQGATAVIHDSYQKVAGIDSIRVSNVIRSDAFPSGQTLIAPIKNMVLTYPTGVNNPPLQYNGLVINGYSLESLPASGLATPSTLNSEFDGG